jgi:hypothetical protein
MPFMLIESPIYRGQKASLSRASRLVVRLVEADIAEDPSLDKRRRPTDQGTIVDQSAEDLLVEYIVVADKIVLLRVYDLRSV